MSTEEDFLQNEGPGLGGGLGIDGQGKMPTLEEIMQLIDSAGGLSDEEKASIKEDVLKFNSPEVLGDNKLLQSSAVAGGLFAPPTILFLFLVAIIALIIGKCTCKNMHI